MMTESIMKHLKDIDRGQEGEKKRIEEGEASAINMMG